MAKHVFGKKICESYEIGEQLGAGAFASVYAAIQKNLKRPVAIKVLKAGRLKSADSKRRFNREAQLLSKISHPNVVQLFDYGLDEGVPYLVQELITGETLEQKLKGTQNHSLEKALDICDGICAALEEAHERGILHRDLKPANVLLCEDGQVKLLDFGLARSYLGDETRMTEEGAILGTPIYMAPELLQGVEATVSTDLYAVGVLLYELLVGEFPFPPNLDSLLHAKLKSNLDLSKLVALNLGIEVEELLASLMAVNAEERISSATELRRLFASLRNTSRGVVGAKSKSKSTERVKLPGRRLKRHILAPLILMLLLPLLLFIGREQVGPKKQVVNKVPLTIRRVAIKSFGATQLTISCTTSLHAHVEAVVRQGSEERVLLRYSSSIAQKNHVFTLRGLPAGTSIRVSLKAKSKGYAEVHRSIQAQTGRVKSNFYWSSFGKELPWYSRDISEVSSVLSSKILGRAGRKGNQFVFNVSGRGLFSLLYPNKKPLWRNSKLTNSRFSATAKDFFFAATRGGKVQCCTWEKGEVLWQRDLGKRIYDKAHYLEGNLILSSSAIGLLALDGKNGKNRWRKKGKCLEHETLFTPVGFLVRLLPDPHFYILSPKDGSVRNKLQHWTRPTGCAPAVMGEELVFAFDSDLVVCHPLGSIRIKKKLEGKVCFVNCYGGDIVVVTRHPAQILAFSQSDGSLRWKRNVPIVVTTPTTLARGLIYCVDDNEHLLCLDPAKGRLLYRLDLDLSDNFGIFPVDEGLLVCSDTGDLLVIDDQ